MKSPRRVVMSHGLNIIPVAFPQFHKTIAGRFAIIVERALLGETVTSTPATTTSAFAIVAVQDTWGRFAPVAVLVRGDEDGANFGEGAAEDSG